MPMKNEYEVRGYATVFDTPYCRYRDVKVEIWEQINRHAFDLTEMNNVPLLHDHEGKPLAETNDGTLLLHLNEKGLFVVADLSKTKESRHYARMVKDRDICNMSFAWTYDKNRTFWRMTERKGRLIIVYTINRILELKDVTITDTPANPDTIAL